MAQAKRAFSTNANSRAVRKSQSDRQLTRLGEQITAALAELYNVQVRRDAARKKIEPLIEKLSRQHPYKGSRVLKLAENSGPAGKRWREFSDQAHRADKRVYKLSWKALLSSANSPDALPIKGLALLALNWENPTSGFAFTPDLACLLSAFLRVGKLAIPEPMAAELRKLVGKAEERA